MTTTTTLDRNALRSLIDAELPGAIELRHTLHASPELMYEETETAKLIAARLTELSIEHVAGLARGTGVLAHLPATVADPEAAPTVGLRADIDALPIAEDTGLPYASKTPGKMHACGHDGHTANLLAAASVLSSIEHRPNNITLLFQPAEEGGAGADAMIADGALNGTRLGNAVDVMYGLHGWPDMPLGQIGVRSGPLLAATDEFYVTIRGKGGHAAFPHVCVDPVIAGAQIVTALQTLASRRTSPTDSTVCTVGAFRAGEAPNVIPQEAEIRGTIRTLRAETREMAQAEFRRIVTGIAESLGCTVDINWHTGYPVTDNNPAATDRVRDATRETVGEANLIELPEPFMGGEDFSYYSQHVPSSFFVVGLKPANADSYPQLHTPRFDFNDDALPVAIEMFTRLATGPLPVQD
jgi:amidohydrolase